MKRAGMDQALRCSFCHKSQDTVAKLISAPSDEPRAYICDECVAVCHQIIDDEGTASRHPATASALPDAEQINAPGTGVFVPRLADRAVFFAAKMGKADIARGEHLFAGLNCFEPGQEHAAHAHAGQDKLYIVVQGEAEIQIGGEKALISAGGSAFAVSGITHSIRNCGASRLIVMAILAPPPAK